MQREVVFQSEGADLRGRLYSHGDARAPIVIMTHGTSATIEMVIDLFAARIHDAGLDVLLYDHRNFGQSGGAPRQEINPWIQARGYRDAVAFLRATSPDRKIALWGDSYSAGLSLVAGAVIDDIAAIVAQIPVCGVSIPEVAFDATDFRRLKDIFETGDVSGGPAQTTGPIPVVSADQINAPSLLAPIQAYRWFIEHGGRHGSGWENRATRVIPDTPVPCSPFVTAPYLTMPVQMIVGTGDEMVHCNPDAQKAVFDRIPGEKAFVEVAGGHFGMLWYPSDPFEAAIAAQIGFLRSALF